MLIAAALTKVLFAVKFAPTDKRAEFTDTVALTKPVTDVLPAVNVPPLIWTAPAETIVLTVELELTKNDEVFSINDDFINTIINKRQEYLLQGATLQSGRSSAHSTRVALPEILKFLYDEEQQKMNELKKSHGEFLKKIVSIIKAPAYAEVEYDNDTELYTLNITKGDQTKSISNTLAQRFAMNKFLNDIKSAFDTLYIKEFTKEELEDLEQIINKNPYKEAKDYKNNRFF